MREIRFRLLLNDNIVGYEKWFTGTYNHDDKYWIALPRWLYSEDGERWYPDCNISYNKKEQFTGLYDKNGIEGCAGDLRKYHGKIYKVVDEVFRFVFERNLVEFGENEDIVIDEDVIFESELIGNIHQNTELLNG